MPGDSRDFSIRKADEKDLSAITSIAAAAYSAYLKRMPVKPFPMLDDYSKHIRNNTAHVLEDESGVRGYVILFVQPPGDLLLDNIAVSPHAQGKGYGRALAAFAEEQGRSLGCRRMVLYTNEVMAENIVWYERLGYKETGRATDGGYRRVYMVKDL